MYTPSSQLKASPPLESSLTPPSPTPHSICQQILWVPTSKYTQKPTTFHSCHILSSKPKVYFILRAHLCLGKSSQFGLAIFQLLDRRMWSATVLHSSNLEQKCIILPKQCPILTFQTEPLAISEVSYSRKLPLHHRHQAPHHYHHFFSLCVSLFGTDLQIFSKTILGKVGLTSNTLIYSFIYSTRFYWDSVTNLKVLFFPDNCSHKEEHWSKPIVTQRDKWTSNGKIHHGSTIELGVRTRKKEDNLRHQWIFFLFLIS